MVGVMIKAAVREGSTAEASVSFLYSRPPTPGAKHAELTAVATLPVSPAPRSAGNSLHLAPEVLPEAAQLTPEQREDNLGAAPGHGQHPQGLIQATGTDDGTARPSPAKRRWPGCSAPPRSYAARSMPVRGSACRLGGNRTAVAQSLRPPAVASAEADRDRRRSAGRHVVAKGRARDAWSQG